MHGAPHEYTMDPNYALFMDDGIFWLYIDAHQLSTSYNLMNSARELRIMSVPVGRGFNYWILYLEHILY